MAGLDLVPFYVPEGAHTVERLSEQLGRVFHTRVRLRHPWFDPEDTYDASRGQYNSTSLLRALLEDPQHGDARLLGVTGVDLFVPVLTFVFGEAQLGGRAAVVSLQRLRAEAYGMPADAKLLQERLLKEAVHELGHVEGLVHCTDPACVMRASTYVEQVDAKRAEFCDECLAQLGAHAAGA